MKNKYINRFLLALPSTQKMFFRYLDIGMDLHIMTTPEKADQLKKAQKTLREIGRLAPRVQAIWLGELIAMLGMIVYNQIDSESHFRAGLVVYPTMLVAAMYAGLLMDKMEKKKDIFIQQMNDANTKQK